MAETELRPALGTAANVPELIVRSANNSAANSESAARGSASLSLGRGRRVPDTQTAIRVLAALSWLFWSSRLFVEIGTFPTAAFWSIAYGLGSISHLILYALNPTTRSTIVLDIILVAGTLLIGVVWVIALIYGSPNYGTDEAAFVQGAAQLLVHGHDPYGANLAWTLQHFAV